MDRQQLALNLLRKTLDELIKLAVKFNDNTIKQAIINNKKYNKVKLSTYTIEDGMNHFATLEEKRNKIILKANTLTKQPYRDIIDDAKRRLYETIHISSVDTDLSYVDLKYRFEALASSYVKLKDELLHSERIIKEHELNSALNTKPSHLIVDNTKDQTKEILSDLLEILSNDYLITINKTNGGYIEIFYENTDINKKLCNFEDLNDLEIKIDADNKIVKKNILFDKV